MTLVKRRFSVTDLQWLLAFMLPYGVVMIGVLIRQRGSFLPIQRAVLTVLLSGVLILVTLGLMCLFRWQLTDLGVKQQGVRQGLLAAGLIFVFMAVPQLYAAYPWRWRSLDESVVYDTVKYLSVGVAEELWMRGLVYTALERRWNRGVAIVGTSIAFGLAHLHHGIVKVFIIGTNGIASSLVRARTGNIVGLMLSHWFLDLMYSFYFPYKGVPSIELIAIKVVTLLMLLLLLWRAPFLAVPAPQKNSATPSHMA